MGLFDYLPSLPSLPSLWWRKSFQPEKTATEQTDTNNVVDTVVEPLVVDKKDEEKVEDKDEKTMILKKFDLKKMYDHPMIVSIGKRKSGKTVLSKAIVEAKGIGKQQIFAHVYTGRGSDYFIWEDYGANIFERKEDFDLTRLLQVQSKMRKNGKEKEVMIIDSSITSYGDFIKPHITEIASNGRCYRIGLIMELQYPQKMTQRVSSQLDYIFIFGGTDTHYLKKVWENHASDIPSYSKFEKTVQQVCKDHTCLVIDKTTYSDKLEDKLFWYKAEYSFRSTSNSI
jgi:hypothetical protein